MKTLLLLRHAKSSWKDPDLEDHDRPLNKRGQRDAPRMGRVLQVEQLLPDLILSSTARRARDTIAEVAAHGGYDGDIIFDPDLYQADPEEYIEVACRLGAEHQCVMIVGHNPGLEELVELLTGDDVHLPTASLVQISLPVQGWDEFSPETRGTLLKVWRPRELA